MDIAYVCPISSPSLRPCPHVPRYFWNAYLLIHFSSTQWAFSKKISVHTDTEKSITKSVCLENWLCKTELVKSSFWERFRRPYENMKTEFWKIPTMNSVIEKVRFHHQKLRLGVDGKPKWIDKYAFSKRPFMCGYKCFPLSRLAVTCPLCRHSVFRYFFSS